MFALDTNTVVHALKGKGMVKERMAAVDINELAIPAVVAFELEMGTLRSAHPEARRRDLGVLFASLQELPFNFLAAEQAAKLRFELERKGMAIGPLDALIAGTALAYGATLVTHNTDEFSRVPRLRIEDWYI